MEALAGSSTARSFHLFLRRPHGRHGRGLGEGEGARDEDVAVAPVWHEEDEEDGENELMVADECVDAWVAADSGAVEHVTNPKFIPPSTAIEPGRERKFVAANGDPIANHGKAHVSFEQENESRVKGSFEVANVTKPLHSVSRICDNKKGMLFTNGEAVVVPEGSLSKFLGSLKVVARYPRKGGLYFAKMRVRVAGAKTYSEASEHAEPTDKHRS